MKTELLQPILIVTQRYDPAIHDLPIATAGVELIESAVSIYAIEHGMEIDRPE